MRPVSKSLLTLLSSLALAGCPSKNMDDTGSDTESEGSEDGGEDDGGTDDGGTDDGGTDDGGTDDGGTDDGGEDGDAELSELVFASPTLVLDANVSSERVFFGDPNGDGHLDVLVSEYPLGMLWFEGDGSGALTEQDTAELDASLEALADAGQLALEFSDGDRTCYSLSALPTAGGDRLLAGIQLRDDTARVSGVALGILESDGAGGWTSTLLETSRDWGDLMPLADLDGNGLAEVLVDVDRRLTLFWDGDEDRRESLGEVAGSSVYPAVWTTTVDGSELGFVFASNFGFGYTEAWTWSPTHGLERIAEGFYTTSASAEVPMGFAAQHVWLHGSDELLRFEPGAPAALASSTPALAVGSFLQTGDFDGSGRLSAVTDEGLALRVADDGSLEELPLTLDELPRASLVADLDGDGLDDLVEFRDSLGIHWLRNISAP